MRFIVLLLFNFTILFPSFANGQSVQLKTDDLKVGISGTAPFVIMEAGNPTPQGISATLWKEIASDLKWKFTYQHYNTVNLALEALKKGEVDIVVGPVTINSQRLENFKFSQPFYQSSLAIAYKKGEFSFWNVIKLLFSFKLLIAIGIFIIILTIVGTLLWLAERKESPDQFPDQPVKGIGTGMWLAIVTMSTTGYGDKAPITLAGRIIAGTWMIVSIISATSMVAGIASVLTFSNFQSIDIKNIEQLNGKKVATISGSPSVDFLKEYNVNIKPVQNLDKAVKMLNEKQVDAIVYDRPQLLFYSQNHEDDDLQIAKAEYYKQGYGFVFPKESPLTYDINRTLLELAEKGDTSKIIEKYLGKEN
ncbi:transporter substrate-binding domain-containing protein [Kaistella jeonii]|uniref:ABC transporter substrate-binding protein n=1 Tax=Kaistella jeonii TaxID=266749 RepID=A0A0C1CW99_9FLAO|nr:transporter substrate-binding domain-containing protein [Kaistella jeonii]KIA88666.1 ABC transporter substrate-binding protein [Kaistella jeonii]SFC09617.1 polar amino acid transport system substrate-binding protein [Kaistella jeonii]VEI95233.1 Glutamine-binding periplasmic protein precursor [Kaistella jeonii]